MFETALVDINGIMDKRFLISIYLPCLIFSTAFIALAAYSLGLSSIISTWGSLALDVQAIIVFLYLSIIYFIAYVLSASLGSIIRLYEGYWDGLSPGFLIKPWKDLRESFYEARLVSICKAIDKVNEDTGSLVGDKDEKMLDEKEKTELKVQDEAESKIYMKRYGYFPPCGRKLSVMPTMLGNVMKAWELYPLLHYNISVPLLWPRLYPLLKDEQILGLLVDARMKLESMVAISVLGAAFAAVGSIYFILVKPSWPLFLLTFWGGLLVWWLSYRSTIGLGRVYGELVAATFDLYRHKLTEKLNLPMQKSLKEERQQWQKVNAFFYRNKNYRLEFEIPLKTAPKQEVKK
jgi:hypothetical protein